jgi:hypothetical protein
VGKHLEEKYIDWYLASIEISSDPIRAFVKRRRHDDDLVALIDHVVREGRTIDFGEVLSKISTWLETFVNGIYVLCCKAFNPTCIIERLGNNLAWRPISFKFDEHKRSVRRDSE